MRGKRAPSAPPTIPGYAYVQFLGAGGFADVFLYEQQRPKRRVAVKVLLADLVTADARHAFDAEADLMAQLSAHPSIVTIHEAGIATDGRPYLAMEYCPRPNLGLRYRKEPFSVADALRIGIEVAGAVETAHRAGILHRDIKPANVLVTEYDSPALTDFGISATTDGAPSPTEGMSIPWSPPESFAEPPTSGIGTDVWALAATVYSLLAGRSPFEVPGGTNTSADLTSRILGSPLPSIGRPDVPASLERILATAMAKSPLARYSSALAFARELQQVQAELGMAVTRAVVNESALVAEPDEDVGEPGTRIRRVVSIDPDSRPSRSGGTSGARTGGERTAGASTGGATAPGREAAPSGTVHRVAPPPPGGPGVDGSGSGAMTSSDTVHRVGVPVPRSGARPAADWGTLPPPPPVATPRPRATAPATEQVTVRPTGAEPAGAEPAPRRRLWGWLVAAALLGVAAVAGVALAGGGAPSSASPTATAEEADPQDVVSGYVPAPEGLAGEVVGEDVVFSWSNPSPQEGDTFAVRVPDDLGDGDWVPIEEPTVTVPAEADGRTCVQVKVVRSTGKASEVAGECAP